MREGRGGPGGGAELRWAGIELPVLVLGTARPAKIALYRRYRLTPTVSSLALWFPVVLVATSAAR